MASDHTDAREALRKIRSVVGTSTEAWHIADAALAASEPEREPGTHPAVSALMHEPNGDEWGALTSNILRNWSTETMARLRNFLAARTPEPAGDSEPTDVRDLRERLKEDAKEWLHHLETFPSDRNGNTLTACDSIADTIDLLTRAAAALERLETLEAALEDTTRHLGLYVQDDGHETNGPEGWVNDADPGAWDAFRRARALFAAPAPAPQGGEGKGWRRYDYGYGHAAYAHEHARRNRLQRYRLVWESYETGYEIQIPRPQGGEG